MRYRRLEEMKTIKISLPDKLGVEVENYIKSGWLTDEGDLLRTALQEFIRHNRLKLMDQFYERGYRVGVEGEGRRLVMLIVIFGRNKT